MSKYKTPRYKWMYDLIEKEKPKTFLEIGVYRGKNAYLIDQQIGLKEYVGFDIEDKIKWPLPPGKIILGRSQLRMPFFIARNPNKYFDLIFIDGDHDPEATIVDFENCLKLTNENTLFFIDDLYIDLQGKIVYEYGAGQLFSILSRYKKIAGFEISPGDPIEPSWNNHILKIIL